MSVTETALRDRGEVTDLLIAWSGGEPRAEERLLPLVYAELHELAASYMRRERAEHTLQPTALVHEAYMRLIDQQRVQWQNRAHFFAIAAQMMRRILVDHARRRQAARRGDNPLALPLTEVDDLGIEVSPDVIAVDEALVALTALDTEKGRIVEMRFFGGLSNAEIAEVLGVSLATIVRHWRVARAWLYRYLTTGVPDAV
jgi:RNA polymerase sigma factor (TIGR02999 family)